MAISSMMHWMLSKTACCEISSRSDLNDGGVQRSVEVFGASFHRDLARRFLRNREALLKFHQLRPECRPLAFQGCDPLLDFRELRRVLLELPVAVFFQFLEFFADRLGEEGLHGGEAGFDFSRELVPHRTE